MGKTIDITVAGKYVGADNIKRAITDMRSLESAGTKSGSVWKSAAAIMSGAALGIGVAMGAIGLAAKTAMAELERGAELERVASRFDNLAKSINTTGDALLGKMREATRGLISDADLMASGTDLMSLKLATTEDGVVRLATVVGELGWDMQQVVLTMANNSKMRLDALGLSVEDVDARVAKLRETGMSLDAAFDLAVIEAGEAKIKLLGSSADTTAGKIQAMKTAVTNARDAFSRTFAMDLADSVSQMAASTGLLAENMEYAATGAGKLAAALTSPLLESAIGMGQTAELHALRAEIEATTDSIPELNEAWFTWLNATAPGTTIEERTRAIQLLKAQLQSINPELRYVGWQRETEAIEETIEAVREFSTALALLGADARGSLADIGEAAAKNRSGWDKSTEAVEMYGHAIDALSDKALAGIEAQRERAEAYRAAALEMTQAFVAALDPENMPDFGNLDAMKQLAFDMASAYGLTIPVLGDIGVQLGVIDSQTAETAAKAAIFQEAFGILLGRLQTGQIDTSQFVGAFDTLITTLEENSLVELQVKLAAPKTSVDDMYWLPDAAKEAMRVPVEVDVVDEALKTALGVIDGIPDNDQKIITFDPEYEAVTTAIGEIESGISNIDGTVVFTPMVDAVEAKINEIDGRHLTIYVDYVPTGTPEIEGRAAGGPVSGGTPYWVGETGPELFIPWASGSIVPSSRASAAAGNMTVNMTVTFNGPADPPAVQRAIRDGMAEFYADVQRQGVRG